MRPTSKACRHYVLQALSSPIDHNLWLATIISRHMFDGCKDWLTPAYIRHHGKLTRMQTYKGMRQLEREGVIRCLRGSRGSIVWLQLTGKPAHQTRYRVKCCVEHYLAHPSNHCPLCSLSLGDFNSQLNAKVLTSYIHSVLPMLSFDDIILAHHLREYLAERLPWFTSSGLKGSTRKALLDLRSRGAVSLTCVTRLQRIQSIKLLTQPPREQSLFRRYVCIQCKLKINANGCPGCVKELHK